MFIKNELKHFYKIMFTVVLVFMSVMTVPSQLLLKTNLSRGYRRNEIGIPVSDGIKLYQEGTVVFSMKDDTDADVRLLRNGVYAGNFASGKIGIYVLEGDVLEFVHNGLKSKKTVYVDSVSANIDSLQKGQAIYLYGHKMTNAGVVRMNERAK